MTPKTIHEFFLKPKNTLLVVLSILVIYSLVSGSTNFDKIFSFFTQTLETLPSAPQPQLLIQPTAPETAAVLN